MDLVNLAHGSLYMMGAYFAATFVGLDRISSRRAAGARATLLSHCPGIRATATSLWPRSSDHVLATSG